MSKDHQPVPPSEYDKKYFLTDCGGYRNFTEHRGLVIDKRMMKSLDMANIQPDMRILDIGSGRGEIVFRAAIKKANAIGVDYSADAIKLAKELKNEYPVTGKKMDFICGSATSLPFDKNKFDRVFMLDVVEHLHGHELDILLCDINKLLRDDGLIIIHTSPNKLFYDYGYRLIRSMIRLIYSRDIERSIRTDYEKKMHVNEQTSRSLHKSLKKAGFSSIVMISETDYIENIVKENATRGKAPSLLLSIVTCPLFSSIFGNSIYAVAWKSGRIPVHKNGLTALNHKDRLDNDELVISNRDEVCEDLVKDRVLMNDIGNIGRGWHALELWPDQAYIRWSTREAYAYLKNDDSNTLKIKFYSHIENRLNISIDGKLIKNVSTNNNSWQVAECKIVDKGIFEVKIALEKTWMPEKIHNDDHRELGIAVEKIWLE